MDVDGAPQLRRPFEGFSSPNYTMVPDQLFDELLASLSGNEVKVLLYITRRTFGFKRDSDNISLSQMLQGIRTAEGRVLDRGVGMSKPTLLKALQSLKEQNIIVARQRRSAERGDEATSYSLNVCPKTADLPRTKTTATSSSTELTAAGGKETSHPVVKILDQGGGKETLPPRGKEALPHNTQSGQTVTKDVKQQHSHRPVHPVEVNERVVVALTDLGVSMKTARDLACKLPEEHIRAQIDMLQYRKADNPAAVLVKAIREEWAPPAGYLTPQEREEEAREAERTEAELDVWRQDQAARSTDRAIKTRPEPLVFRPFAGTPLDSRQIWAAAMPELRATQGAEPYLSGSRILEREDDCIVVGVSSAYAAEWLGRRIAREAARHLSAIGGEPVETRFVAESQYQPSGYR